MSRTGTPCLSTTWSSTTSADPTCAARCSTRVPRRGRTPPGPFTLRPVTLPLGAWPLPLPFVSAWSLGPFGPSARPRSSPSVAMRLWVALLLRRGGFQTRPSPGGRSFPCAPTGGRPYGGLFFEGQRIAPHTPQENPKGGHFKSPPLETPFDQGRGLGPSHWNPPRGSSLSDGMAFRAYYVTPETHERPGRYTVRPGRYLACR